MHISDNRLIRFAQVLIHYSLHVQPGELVAITAHKRFQMALIRELTEIQLTSQEGSRASV